MHQIGTEATKVDAIRRIADTSATIAAAKRHHLAPDSVVTHALQAAVDTAVDAGVT